VPVDDAAATGHPPQTLSFPGGGSYVPTSRKQPPWIWIAAGVVAAVVLLCGFGAVIGAVSDEGTDADERTGQAADTGDDTGDDKGDDSAAPAGDASATAEPEPEPEPEPAPRLAELPEVEAAELGGSTGKAMTLPRAERRFLAIVADAQEAAADANEIGVVQARHRRGQQLCRLLGSGLQARSWTAVVDSVETTLGGDAGVLELSIADGVKVATWNNSLSDFDDQTLIKEGSPVWRLLAELEEGDVVRFTASFVRDEENCVRESSLIDVNGLLTPTFIARFSAVEKL